MNSKLGRISAAVTGLSVLGFAVSMIVGVFTGSATPSFLASMCIALGFLPLICAITGGNPKKESRGMGLAAVGFAAVYVVLIMLVYFAAVTTVRMNPGLSEEVRAIIDYEHLGSLYFNYDLLGYGFMALATFFASFSVEPKDKGDRAFRMLLRIHGIFAVSCFIMPMFPLFTTGTNPLIGTAVLEFWCIYFLPVCILGWRYFREKKFDKR